MMKSKYQKQISKKFKAIAKDKGTFRKRLACILLNSHIHSPFIELLLVFLEYAQLLSQALLLYSFFQNAETEDDCLFLKGVLYTAKIFNPSYLLTYEDQYTSTKTILFIIMGWLILKLMLCLYILLISASKFEPHPLLLRSFKGIFQAQARVIYYFASSFFVRVILLSNQDENQFSFLGIGKAADFGVCIVIIILEFCLSSLLKINFHYVLPSKSFLSSKDNTSELLTLTQKFLLQILQIILWDDSEASRWVLIIANCLITFIRDYQFFTSLPMYRIPTLIFQGSLLVIVSTFHYISLIQQIIISSETENINNVNMEFTIVVWILLSLLAVKVSHGFLNKTISGLITQKTCQKPKLLIHKISLFKQLMNHRKIAEESSKFFDWLYLLTTTVNVNVYDTFGVKLQQENTQNSKGVIKSISILYLENLFQKFPRNGIIKLYLAFYYAKRDKVYSKAIALINEFQNHGWSQEALSSYFLLHHIEDKIKTEYTQNSANLDLYTIVKSYADLDHVKSQMLKQSEIQAKICQELLSNAPNLDNIFEHAQTAESHRISAESAVTHFLNVTPDYYLSPLLTFAYYHLVINQSPGICTKLYEKYHLLTQKYQRYLKSDKLCQQNVYQDTCAFFILSGHKTDIGKVINCSSAVKKVCGGDSKWYIGSKIFSQINLPSLRHLYENYYRAFAENGASLSFNQITRNYIYNKEGYISEADIYLSTHPSISQGYFMTLIVRLPSNQNDFIILKENGEIEGASRKVCRRLNLFITNPGASSGHGCKHHINRISPELSKVNEAFRLVSKRPEGHITTNSGLALEEAEQLCSHYQNQGIELDLKPISRIDPHPVLLQPTLTGSHISHSHSQHHENDEFQHQDSYHYHCRISQLVFGPVTLRVLHLEERKKGSDVGVINVANENTNYTPGFGTRESKILGNEDSDIATEGSDKYAAGDEKEQGWIDLSPLGVAKQQSPLRRTQTGKENKEKVKSNPVLGGFFTQVINQTTGSPNLPLFKQIIGYKSLSSMTQSLDQIEEAEKNAMMLPQRIAESINNSTSSKQSSARRTAENFRYALKTNYSSKIFKIGAVCYLLLTSLILASILYLSLNLSNITDDLQTKKDIMINAQTRAFNLATVQTTLRTQYDLFTGGLISAELGSLAKSASEYTSINRGYISPILQTNKNLLTMTSYLDETSRQIIFNRDVNIIYTDTEVAMTSFQATGTVIQSILDIMTYFSANTAISAQMMWFTNINLLNDVATKNDEISDVTLTSAQGQVDSIQTIVIRYYIFIATLILLLICSLFLLIWKQHLRCTNNLLQTCKLNPIGVQTVLEQQRSFKGVLNINNELNESKFFGMTENFKYFNMPTAKTTTDKAKKKESSVNPNHKGIQRKFIIQLIKSNLLSLLLASSLIFTTLFAPSSMSYFNTKLSQISFATQISTKVTRSQSASLELAISNDTMMIQGMLPSAAVESSIESVNQIRNKIYDTFFDSDSSTSLEINHILFGNGCQLLSSSDAFYCSILEQKSLNSSLVQLLWSFESLIAERYEAYQLSNKSSAALRENRIMLLDTLLSLRRIIANEGLLILNFLNEDFEQKTVDFNKQRNVNFICTWILFALFAIAIWIFVLHPVKRNDNKFKNVLQMFPAQLVLSNFSIKKFLMETSPLGSLYISMK